MCCLLFIFIDGDWEADHEKYAKFDEDTKNRWPDGTVSVVLLINNNYYTIQFIFYPLK